jgi:hypothetical protein
MSSQSSSCWRKVDLIIGLIWVCRRDRSSGSNKSLIASWRAILLFSFLLTSEKLCLLVILSPELLEAVFLFSNGFELLNLSKTCSLYEICLKKDCNWLALAAWPEKPGYSKTSLVEKECRSTRAIKRINSSYVFVLKWKLLRLKWSFLYRLNLSRLSLNSQVSEGRLVVSMIGARSLNSIFWWWMQLWAIQGVVVKAASNGVLTPDRWHSLVVFWNAIHTLGSGDLPGWRSSAVVNVSQFLVLKKHLKLSLEILYRFYLRTFRHLRAFCLKICIFVKF